MKKNILIVIVIFSIISCNKNTSDSICQIVNIENQKKTEREYFKSTPVLVKKINIDSLNIFKPTFLKIYKNEIFIMDYTDFSIHKLSLNGNYIKTINTGRGQGPGEFQNPFDMKIFKDMIYISDTYNGRVEVYKIDGNFSHSMKIDSVKIPNRIIPYGNNLLVSKILDSPNKLFNIIDTKNGDFIKSFGNYLYNKTEEFYIAHDHHLYSITDNKYCYAPMYLGYLAIYSNEKLKIIKETIDGIHEVKMVKEERNGLTINKPHQEMSTSSYLTVFSNFILNKSYEYESKNQYYDIYSSKKLDYLGSIKGLSKLYRFDIDNRKLYGLEGTHLYIYNISEIIDEIEKRKNNQNPFKGL